MNKLQNIIKENLNLQNPEWVDDFMDLIEADSTLNPENKPFEVTKYLQGKSSTTNIIEVSNGNDDLYVYKFDELIAKYVKDSIDYLIHNKLLDNLKVSDSIPFKNGEILKDNPSINFYMYLITYNGNWLLIPKNTKEYYAIF